MVEFTPNFPPGAFLRFCVKIDSIDSTDPIKIVCVSVCLSYSIYSETGKQIVLKFGGNMWSLYVASGIILHCDEGEGSPNMRKRDVIFFIAYSYMRYPMERLDGTFWKWSSFWYWVKHPGVKTQNVFPRKWSRFRSQKLSNGKIWKRSQAFFAKGRRARAGNCLYF